MSVFLLVWGLCAEAKVEIKYTDLRNAVVPTNISMEFEQTDFERQLYPTSCTDRSVCTCQLADDACKTPTFNFDENTFLHISFSVPEDVGERVVSSVKDETYEEPTKVTIKACYSKPDTLKRKWRKIKNVIDDDKRCAKKIVKGFDLVPGQTDYTLEPYELPSDTPKANWFLTLYFLCPIKKTDDTNFCGMDTTGVSLSEFMSADDLRSADPEVDVNAVLVSTRSNELYYQTDVMDSVPTEMVVGVIALSLVAIVFLVSFFTWERFLKKQA